MNPRTTRLMFMMGCGPVRNHKPVALEVKSSIEDSVPRAQWESSNHDCSGDGFHFYRKERVDSSVKIVLRTTFLMLDLR